MKDLTIRRQRGINLESTRKEVLTKFWEFTYHQHLLNDSECLAQIKRGYPVDLSNIIHATFDLSLVDLETLFNLSSSTLARHKREQKTLSSFASERLNRIASICHLGVEVFQSKEATVFWMSKSNKALGGAIPVLLCTTEIGGRQVRRVLRSLEYGGMV